MRHTIAIMKRRQIEGDNSTYSPTWEIGDRGTTMVGDTVGTSFEVCILTLVTFPVTATMRMQGAGS
jgi:hypothetical protein